MSGKQHSIPGGRFGIAVVAIVVVLLILSWVPLQSSSSAGSTGAVTAQSNQSHYVAGSASRNSLPAAQHYSSSYVPSAKTFDRYLLKTHQGGLENSSPAAITPYSTGTAYKITFTVTNLQAGHSWTAEVINLNDVLLSSLFNFTSSYSNTTTSSSMSAYLSNGTYLLLAGPVTPDLLVAEFNVTGAPLTITFPFPAFYKIVLNTDTALHGNLLNIVVIGTQVPVLYVNSSAAGTMIAYLPNGTYSVEGGLGSVYITLEKGFTVSGAQLSVNLHFPALFALPISETGISSGLAWNFEVVNPTYSISLVRTTDSTSVTVYLPNGTYEVTGGRLNTFMSVATVVMSGNHSVVHISFPVFYRVTFNENGLPADTYWSISVLNCNFSQYYSVSYSNISTGSQKIAFLPDGIYDMTYGSSLYSSSGAPNFAVTGQSIWEQISFPKVYKTTFAETGLPTGVEWQLNLYSANGSSFYYYNFSSGDSIVAYLPNGTYNYAYTIGNYYTVSSGTLNVNGHSQSVALLFPQISKVTVSGSNLHAGFILSFGVWNSNYSVNGEWTESAATYSIYLPNGSYYIQVSEVSASNFNSYAFNATQFTVAGSNVLISDSFPWLYAVQITETGLYPGFYWSAASYSSSSGFSNSSTTNSTFVEYLHNGTYTVNAFEAFSVSSFNTYGLPEEINSPSVTFTVHGPGATATVKFPHLYQVTFNAAGLEQGVTWFLSFQNVYYNVTYSSEPPGASVTVAVPNGTYYYQARAGLYPVSGSFTVSGASQSVDVVFPHLYRVTFVNDELIACTGWFIEVNNTSGYQLSYTYPYVSSYSVYLPNGSYNYFASYYAESAHSGFSVSGASLIIHLSFPGFYKITFTERGLPSGTDWYVNTTGYFSGPVNNNSFSMYMRDGAYDYTPEAAHAQGYSYSSQSMVTVVNGAATTVSVNFTTVLTPGTFAVTFTEHGLPSGLKWYLNLTGLFSLSSLGTSITSGLHNGTYSYSLSNLTEYYAVNSSSSFTVSGSSLAVSVEYLHYAYIYGSISPVNATVKIDGKSVTVASGKFNVTVPAGTYSMAVSFNGYRTYYTNVTISAGQAKNVSVSLKAASVSLLQGDTLYIIVGGAIAAVVVATVAFLSFRRHKK